MAESLGEAVLELRTDSTKLDKGLAAAEGKAKGAQKAFDAIGASLVSAFSSAAVINSIRQITQSFAELSSAALELAADAQETENLFNVSLGSMQGEAEEFAESLSFDLGLDEVQVKEFTGVMNQMLKSMGLGAEAAFDMSKGMTQLTFDMGSFFNLDPAEAFQKIQAGISGEVEPLKRLGIVLSATAVEQEALTMGLIKQGETLTEQQKILARYSLLMKQTEAAQGDLARTSDSLTNVEKRLEAATRTLVREFGEGLIPAATQAKKALADFAQDERSIEFVEALGKAVGDLAIDLQAIGGAFKPGGPGAPFIGFLALLADQTPLRNLVQIRDLIGSLADRFETVKFEAVDIDTELEQWHASLDKAAEDALGISNGFEAASVAASDLGDSVTEVVSEADALRNTVESLSESWADALDQSTLEQARENTRQWALELANIEQLWEEVGQSIDEALTPTGEQLDAMTEEYARHVEEGFEQGKEAAKKINWGEVGDVMGQAIAGEMFFAIRDLLNGRDFEGVFREAGANLGRTFGAAIGSKFGPFGEAAGAAFGEFFGEKVGETIGKAFDSIFNSPNLKEKIQKFFKHFDAGTASIEQTVKAIDLLAAAVRKMDDPTRVLTEHFDEVFDAAMRLGGEAVDALERLAEEIEKTGKGADLLAEKLRDVMNEAMRVLAERKDFILGQVDQLLSGLDKIGESSQFAADSIVAAFNLMAKSGFSLFEIMDKLGPSVEKLRNAGKDFGEEFGRLGKVFDVLGQEKFRKIIGHLDGMGEAMEALGNLNLATQESFSKFANTASSAFEELVKGGLSAEEAYAALAPQLQILNDLQEQYGFTLNETNQALLDEAKALGFVTAKGLTTEDILIKGFDRMLEALNRIIVALGGIPVAFDSIADSAANAANVIDRDLGGAVDDLGKKMRGFEGGFGFGPRGGVPNFNAGSDGFQDFGTGTPAMLHGTEEVITASEGTGIARMVRAAIEVGSAGGDQSPAMLAEQTRWLAMLYGRAGEHIAVERDIARKLDRKDAKPFIQGQR